MANGDRGRRIQYWRGGCLLYDGEDVLDMDEVLSRVRAFIEQNGFVTAPLEVTGLSGLVAVAKHGSYVNTQYIATLRAVPRESFHISVQFHLDAPPSHVLDLYDLFQGPNCIPDLTLRVVRVADNLRLFPERAILPNQRRIELEK